MKHGNARDVRNAARAQWMALWTLSGFSTLTLELIWMREMALWAGSTVIASTLVTAVFFSCAALGNLWGARLADQKRDALIWYGRFEVAAACCALLTFALSRWLRDHSGVLPQSGSAQALMAVLLAGPSSFCAGVAFPILAGTFVSDPRYRTASAAPFYGLNLLGGSLGVVAGGVWLPWKLGMQGAFVAAAALQCGAGWLAWQIARRSAPDVREAPAVSERHASPAALGWLLLGASGVLSLAAQSLSILWVRQILEGSVYAVGGVLGAFIGGLGLGALAAGALRRRGWNSRGLLSCFAGSGAVLLFVLPQIGAALSIRDLALTADTPTGLVVQSLAWCAPALLPLTFCLGGVFPLAWELTGAGRWPEGRMLGTALAVNKLCCAAGAVVGLFVLAPLAGLAHGSHLIAWGYAAIALVVKRSAWPWLAPVAALGLWQTSTPQASPGVTPELRVLGSTTGAYGPVTVVEDEKNRSRQILLNSRQRLSGTGRALSSQRHQSWVPLLFCRTPERVFTIGMAAGISAAAALDFPIGELYAVELVPEVVSAARDYFALWNRELFSDPRARVLTGDGRIQLAQSSGRFDAIICDLLFPTEEGTAQLYSRDFLALARDRLSPGGVFCLWLPCHQLTPQTAGSVVRTFLDVFPCAIAVRTGFDPLQPVIGLIGSNDRLPVSREYFAARLATPEVEALATRSPFLRSPYHAMLLLAGDLRSANPGFAHYPPTTDDHPLFAWIGPREPRGRERLFGFPFLDWIGKRFLRAEYPSCELDATEPGSVLRAVRAGNFTYAAAAALQSIPGDPRPEATRRDQVANYLRQAHELHPAAALAVEDLLR